MKEVDFLKNFCKDLEVEFINPEDLADEGYYDSLAQLSLISTIDSEFGSDATDDSIKKATTIQEVLDILKGNGFLKEGSS